MIPAARAVTSPVKSVIHPSDGEQFWLRPDQGKGVLTGDEAVFRDFRREYKKMPDPSGLRVMDCGAHIGCLTRHVLALGATYVHSYEPHPRNAELLRANVESYRQQCRIHEVALAKSAGTATFHARPDASASHGLHPRRLATDTIEVTTLGFWDEVDRVRPELIKLDLEGGEFLIGLDERPLPSSVRVIGGEFHASSKAWRAALPPIYTFIESQGFSAVQKPVLEPSSFWPQCIAWWQR